jgi:hypothetical protein
VRELDAKVAEKVFGASTMTDDSWPFQESYPNPDYNGQIFWRLLRKYTSDAAADYEVLKHVREKWEDDLTYSFHESLFGLWRKRSKNAGWSEMTPLVYEPGDYSIAALKALGEDIG